MNDNPSGSSRRGARTFRATCVVLATVAAAQAAATAWTAKPPQFSGLPVLAENPEKPETPVKPKAADPFSPDYRPEDPHPELQGPAGEAPPAEDPGVVMVKNLQPPTAIIPRPKLAAP